MSQKQFNAKERKMKSCMHLKATYRHARSGEAKHIFYLQIKNVIDLEIENKHKTLL